VRGKTSADIANGDIPAVGAYAAMKRIPNRMMENAEATPSFPSWKENASINIITNMGTNPRSSIVARPIGSRSQKAGTPKLFTISGQSSISRRRGIGMYATAADI
jgi:hypothetical protein